MVTAYDYPSAQVAEEAGVDVVLVGDSAAMTVLGYPTTVPVRVDEMLMLAAAVRRGLHTPLLVGDLPFGSYEGSNEQAIATRPALRQGGRLRRGQARARRHRPSSARAAIVGAGIPVMGHVGLTPQTATALGGYRSQGRTAERALEVVARRARAAGGRLLRGRLRGGPERADRGDHAALEIPVIGIGAGPATDGQVLVFHDLLGIYDGHARALRQALRERARGDDRRASQAYADDVRERRYPEPEHGYTMAPDEIERLQELLSEQTGEPFTGGLSL